MNDFVASLMPQNLPIFLLLSIRSASVFFMTPVFYMFAIPATVRVTLLLGISFSIGLSLSNVTQSPNIGFEHVFAIAASELAIGSALGLGVLLAFASISFAGSLLDVQIGFGIAQVFDPSVNRPVPILSATFSMVAVLIFFLLDAHHALLRGLAWSFEVVPLGTLLAVDRSLVAVLKQIASCFVTGFALAAPITLSVLLVDFVLSIVSRSLPQMNMFTVGIPLKIIVGLVTLSLWFSGIGRFIEKSFSDIFLFWQMLLIGSGR
jgi:flagellar biosynthesis protein FliR